MERVLGGTLVARGWECSFILFLLKQQCSYITIRSFERVFDLDSQMLQVQVVIEDHSCVSRVCVCVVCKAAIVRDRRRVVCAPRRRCIICRIDSVLYSPQEREKCGTQFPGWSKRLVPLILSTPTDLR